MKSPVPSSGPVAIPGPPFATLAAGFLGYLFFITVDGQGPRLNTAAIRLETVTVLAIRPIANPLIHPVWLQHWVMIGIPGAGGVAIALLFASS